MILRALATALLAAIALPLGAQQHEPPNGLFLVAKPDLTDPNFRQTVVLVTQARDGSTVGVILNRPTRLDLATFVRDRNAASRYRDAVFFGGPVMTQVIVSLFQASQAPEAAAFHVLKGLYLSMHPDNLSRLLSEHGGRYRLYAGFSGWAPNQLQSEMQRDGWFVLPADAETIFRPQTDGLWSELVERAARRPVLWNRMQKRKAPPQAGL
jgi:putative transcriptional regulator